jgi:hypothetical protein
VDEISGCFSNICLNFLKNECVNTKKVSLHKTKKEVFLKYKGVNTRVLDGKRLYYSFLAGAQRIFEHQKNLNKINVFPVQDGDTGTNIASTMRAIIDTYIPTTNLKQTADAIADARTRWCPRKLRNYLCPICLWFF